MTNQVRKDAGLWAQVCAGLVERLKGNVRFWLHTDVAMRHWSYDALIADFALGEYVYVTNPPCDDQWLARQYRKCACTFLPSSGEGFGYPLFESIACGTPVVHGDYAGGASLMASCGFGLWLVPAREWRLEGVHNSVRPVYNAGDWVEMIMIVLEQKQRVAEGAVDHLAWSRLGHVWKRWLREGL